jgi:hypothetical protein
MQPSGKRIFLIMWTSFSNPYGLIS